jgi:hypothetical protein
MTDSERARYESFLPVLDNALSVGNQDAEKPGLKGWKVRQQNREIRRFKAYVQQRLNEECEVVE